MHRARSPPGPRTISRSHRAAREAVDEARLLAPRAGRCTATEGWVSSESRRQRVDEEVDRLISESHDAAADCSSAIVRARDARASAPQRGAARQAGAGGDLGVLPARPPRPIETAAARARLRVWWRPSRSDPSGGRRSPRRRLRCAPGGRNGEPEHGAAIGLVLRSAPLTCARRLRRARPGGDDEGCSEDQRLVPPDARTGATAPRAPKWRPSRPWRRRTAAARRELVPADDRRAEEAAMTWRPARSVYTLTDVRHCAPA